MEKLYITWDEVSLWLNQISKKIPSTDSSSAIVGLSRGGLIPAVLFSHLNSISTFYSCGVKSYDGSNKNTEIMFQYPDKHVLSKCKTVYVIDDICDTGGTLKFIKNYLLPINTVSITLVYRKNEAFKPDYYGIELLDERWVVFPWEETK